MQRSRRAAPRDSGSPIHQSSPSGSRDLVGEERADRAAGDPPDELAGEPAVGAHVVAGRARASSQRGACARELVHDRGPRERLLEREVAFDHRAARPSARARARTGMSLLAVRRELGPVRRRPARRGRAAPRSMSRLAHDRGRALRGREDDREGVVGASGRSAGDVGDARRDVHDRAGRRRRRSTRRRRHRLDVPSVGVRHRVPADAIELPARRALRSRGGVYGGPTGRIRGWPRGSTSRRLGCPKNAVDSDKVVASLLADGLVPAERAEDADLVVVNTCAFIDAARQESIDIALGAGRREAARGPARGHRLHGRALRRRARGGAARGRRGGRLRGRGRARRGRAAWAASRPASGTCSSCPGPRRRRRGRT